MPNVLTPGDVTVFSAGGESVLCNAEGVTIALDSTLLDGSCIGRDGTDMQPVGGMGTVSWSNLSTVGNSGYTRLISSGITVLTLGGVDYNGAWTSLGLKVNFTSKDQRGGRDYQQRMQVLRRGFELTLELNVYAGTAAALMAAAASSAPADKTTTVAVTIGGTSIGFPGRLKSVTFKHERDGFQTLSVVVVGADPGTGTYPTVSGAAGLLLLALGPNFKAQVPFAFTSAATGGFAATGQLSFQDVSISAAIDQFVKIDYNFALFGTLALA